MEHIYLPEPTENIWKKSAEEFENRWGFPNCIGSVDGKHVTIKRPNNSGSNYCVPAPRFLPGQNEICSL
ncbi:unnamed protein product [Acanthoscelides obtectus]|uniref:DDE Tnp4 domain-containing protein n=1 Tax=Acanthoscelides obtectus TaxID=200917 RepID=A0A9P0LCM1_ACAOB|nr:unnamed protein product [Acanthoscelides obtectus]CAK1669564.1 hypothetical protein AOBTE_LOCUS27072 [Acanthoscelides obtectus]